MKQTRAIILIDGSNFYFKLKDLDFHHLKDFNFSAFLNFLKKESKILKAIYYVGAIKTDGTV